MTAMRNHFGAVACTISLFLSTAVHAAQPSEAALSPLAPASGDQPAAAWRPVGFPQ